MLRGIIMVYVFTNKRLDAFCGFPVNSIKPLGTKGIGDSGGYGVIGDIGCLCSTVPTTRNMP